MSWWQAWREQRQWRRRAASFLRSLQQEPAASDVEWLARHGTAGDADHARWELRYARRALGLLTAQRDALDDRTPSLIARELTHSFATDPNIAADRRVIAERQFNDRLRAYADALERRDASPMEPTRARLGRALLAFAGNTAQDERHTVRAGDLLAGYLLEANEALRREFGSASLPEDVPPSALQSGGR